jgi:hypothetical protein
MLSLKKVVLIGGTTVLAGTAGVAMLTSANATTPTFTRTQVEGARAAAGHYMEAPGKVQALVGKGKDVLDSFYPGENPYGQFQAVLAGDDVVVEEATSGFRDPSGFITGPPDTAATPVVAIVAVNDLTTGKSLGFLALSSAAQLSDVHAKEATLRGKGAAEASIDVTATDIAKAHGAR